jgi:hypothetical protein
MDLRYNGLALVNGNPPDATVGEIGDLATLIQWHRSDPPDDFEMNRNNVIYDWQFNRNPFIDLPELVEFIYGTQVGQPFTLSNESFELTQIKLTPNPADNVLTLSGLTGKSQVTIYDQLGRKVKTFFAENNSPITHGLTSGMYLVQISSDNARTTKKLIVR